jgi:hypothetical protein
MTSRTRKIAAAILRGTPEAAVTDRNGIDPMLPRRTANCAKVVGKRASNASPGTCTECLAHAGTDALGRLKPHDKGEPPYDRCPGQRCTGKTFRQLYGFDRAYTRPLCYTCSGASDEADAWTRDPWAPEWGGAA